LLLGLLHRLTLLFRARLGLWHLSALRSLRRTLVVAPCRGLVPFAFVAVRHGPVSCIEFGCLRRSKTRASEQDHRFAGGRRATTMRPRKPAPTLWGERWKSFDESHSRTGRGSAGVCARAPHRVRAREAARRQCRRLP